MTSVAAPASGGEAAAGRRRALRLLTYNVLASTVYQELRTEAVFRILAESNADVIALQEVAGWILTPLMMQKWLSSGYHVTRHRGQPFAPGGQLILSRLPIDNTKWAVLPGKQRRTVLVAEMRLEKRTFAVATTHMESFREDGPTRAQQLKAIFELLEPADDAVLMGDLNFGDGEQPETAHLDRRYHDLWRVLHPDDPGFTWSNEDNPLARIGAFVGEPSRRLDRILLRSGRWRPASVSIIGDRSAGRRRLSQQQRARIQMPDVDAGAAEEPMIEVFPSDHYGLIGTLTRR